MLAAVAVRARGAGCGGGAAHSPARPSGRHASAPSRGSPGGSAPSGPPKTQQQTSRGGPLPGLPLRPPAPGHPVPANPTQGSSAPPCPPPHHARCPLRAQQAPVPCPWGWGCSRRGGLTLQAGGAHPARAAAAPSVDGVTGRPIEAGAGPAAVEPVGGGRAGCGREGPSGAGGLHRPGAAGQASLPLAWTPLGTTDGVSKRPPGSCRHPGGGPGPSPGAPRAAWASRTLRTAGAPAAGRAEAGAAHRVTGAPAARSQLPRQSRPKKPAGQAAESGRREVVVMGRVQGGGVRPPPRPTAQLTAFTEGSPPAGRAGARPADVVTGCPVLTLAALPTARPKVEWPWGHPETCGPRPPSARVGETH